jgi:hypothetical protein
MDIVLELNIPLVFRMLRACSSLPLLSTLIYGLDQKNEEVDKWLI